MRLAAHGPRNRPACTRLPLDGWRTADPANLEARYNWALTSLLLDTAHPSAAAVEVMEKFYQGDSANPLYITGAAFARFRLGNVQPAAALLAKLPPAALQRPQRVPYAAAIFAAAGKCDAAKAVEKVAPAEAALLPEGEVEKRDIPLEIIHGICSPAFQRLFDFWSTP